jgi:hypothetical protein
MTASRVGPRACDSCGSLYQPHRSTSRYCSGTCRKRAQRSGLARPVAERAPAPAAPRGGQPVGTLHAAVLAELKAAGRDTSALGQACLALATRIDFGQSETGSALASLTRELRGSLSAALETAAGAPDALDELAEARRKRLAGGT